MKHSFGCVVAVFRIIRCVGCGYTELFPDVGSMVNFAGRFLVVDSVRVVGPDRLKTRDDSTDPRAMSPSHEYKTVTHHVGQLRPDLHQTLDYYSSQGWRVTHFTAAAGDLRRISLQRRPTD
jgi:hypothetical protein